MMFVVTITTSFVSIKIGSAEVNINSDKNSIEYIRLTPLLFSVKQMPCYERILWPSMRNPHDVDWFYANQTPVTSHVKTDTMQKADI